MAGNQIRAEFGTLDQLAADQSSHAGSIENYRAILKDHVRRALDNFDAGVGSDEHNACMAKVDQLIDEHINATRQFQSSTNNVHDTFRAGGQMARQILGSGG